MWFDGPNAGEPQSLQKVPKSGYFLNPHLRCAYIFISMSTLVLDLPSNLNYWECFLLCKLVLWDVPCLHRCQERAKLLLPSDTQINVSGSKSHVVSVSSNYGTLTILIIAMPIHRNSPKVGVCSSWCLFVNSI